MIRVCPFSPENHLGSGIFIRIQICWGISEVLHCTVRSDITRWKKGKCYSSFWGATVHCRANDAEEVSIECSRTGLCFVPNLRPAGIGPWAA